MKLLHIDSSIQGESSVSRRVSAAVVEQLRVDIPDLDVSYRDLVATPIDHLKISLFGGAQAELLLEEFLAADIVVIGAALYNFTISTQLKAWIDRIVRPDHTYRYGKNGPEGLAGGKRVIVAISRGGAYGEGSPSAGDEHAQTLLRTVFRFIGIDDAQFIVAEGVDLGETQRKAAIEAALEQVGQLAHAKRAAA